MLVSKDYTNLLRAMNGEESPILDVWKHQLSRSLSDSHSSSAQALNHRPCEHNTVPLQTLRLPSTIRDDALADRDGVTSRLNDADVCSRPCSGTILCITGRFVTASNMNLEIDYSLTRNHDHIGFINLIDDASTLNGL